MSNKTIGIQIGAISFTDEGITRVLDLLQEKAKVNTLFIASYTFDRGTGGRQLPGYSLPDHGVQEYDLDFRGGNFAEIHQQYYANTIIKDFRAPDHGDLDILAEVLPEAKKRNIDVYCWINENPYSSISKYVPNFPKVLEIDCYGRKTILPCFNNPDYRNFHLSLVEDYCKSYNISGILWGSERQGPLGNLIDGGWSSNYVGCFCEHCRELAYEHGINVDRAIKGYQLLSDFFLKAEKLRPNDGYFVTFWRILLDYPEILAWEKLWMDSLMSLQKEIYGITKAINPEIKVGWHIMHLLSFSPFYRAEQDYIELKNFSDFIKIALYNNCAGGRFVRFLQSLHRSILHDADPEDSLKLMYKILGIAEDSLDRLPTTGFSAEYVRRETERAVRGVDGQCSIWPGIDIDIPTKENEKKTSPKDVKEAVKAAFTGGADGIILSRKYSEMKLSNLEAVGEVLEELGF